MDRTELKQTVLKTLRKTAKRAPLLLCVAVLGLCYLVLAAFGVTGGKSGSDTPPEPDRTVLSSETAPAQTDDAPDTAAESERPETQSVSTEAPTTAAPTTEAPTETETAPSEGRVIYLTFDDGPGRNTEEVLGILDRYHVRATFFTVGYYVDHYPEIAASIVDHGQLIACHTYTHEYDKCYASADAFMDELEQWKQAVKNATGSVPERVCIRFPGGSKTPNAKNVSDAIKERLRAGGYHWFDWNAADSDKYPKGNTKHLPDEEYFWESYQQTIGWYENDPNAQVIFLTHDSENGTVAILPRMIEDLLDRGYTFKTLDQHPEWG